MLHGVAVSPGVAIGPAYVVDRNTIRIPKRTIDKSEADAELGRYLEAHKRTQEQLEAIKGRLPHGEHRQILKAQQLMLRDPHMTHRVEAAIREQHVGAEQAVARVAEAIRETLAQADAEHFRERGSDISFLADRVLLNLLGEKPSELRPPAGAIVVAHELSPADTAQLVRTDVVGIVTEIGGRTSHSAITARSMEIAAVMGVEGLLEEVEEGDILVIDAIHGMVLARASQAELEEWNEARTRYDAFEDYVQKEHGLPAMSKCGQRVTIRANVALHEEVASSRFHGAEGVGLFRTEFLYLERDTPPTEEEHYRHAKRVLRRMAPYPVNFRTFDLGSDKKTELLRFAEREANPAMGVRSLRLALREREMFLAQLRGLLRAAVHGPLRIMLPLVSGVSELKLAREVVDEAKQQLEDARMAYAQDVPVGIMVEMPSAAVVADLLAKQVDFMSIGTNDLIQYTLAIDRENDNVSYLYRPLHPAILRLIKTVTDAGAEAGIPVSVCGEMAADPRYTWVLAGLGVRELSMQPTAIPVIKNIIRASELAEMQGLATEVLEATDVDAAERSVIDVMRARFAEHLDHGGGQRFAAEVPKSGAGTPTTGGSS